MRVALVHDWLLGWGGAEAVLFEIAKLFPQAPIFTSVVNRQLWPEEIQAAWSKRKIHTSFIQNIPGATKHYQKLLPLMPMAFENLNLQPYDLIISSSHACAKGVIPRPDALHLSYVHTPLRYAWDQCQPYLKQAHFGRLKRGLAYPLLHYLRLWDQYNSQRIDKILANSAFVAQRLKKYHRVDAEVLHPPIRVPETAPVRQEKDYFLYAGRLVAYKQVELLIKTFNTSGKKLVIVGDGPEAPQLKRLAKNNIQFKGRVSDQALTQSFLEAKALLFPALEDFGMIPLEAMAQGCPVIAFGQGGALETVIHGETGLLFDYQNSQSIQAALALFPYYSFDATRLHTHAQGFAVGTFIQAFKQHINGMLIEHGRPEIDFSDVILK